MLALVVLLTLLSTPLHNIAYGVPKDLIVLIAFELVNKFQFNAVNTVKIVC